MLVSHLERFRSWSIRFEEHWSVASGHSNYETGIAREMAFRSLTQAISFEFRAWIPPRKAKRKEPLRGESGEGQVVPTASRISIFRAYSPGCCRPLDWILKTYLWLIYAFR